MRRRNGQHSARADANAAASQDVLAFCRLHPTLDHPEMAFLGTAYRPGMRPAALQGTDVTNWRCMAGEVFVCVDSADGDWCARKDPGRRPSPAVAAFCRDNPGSDFVMTAAEAPSASTWRCRGAAPVISQTWALDGRGFMRRMWPRLVIRNGVIVAPRAEDFGTR